MFWSMKGFRGSGMACAEVSSRSDRHEGAAKRHPETRYSLSTARIFDTSSSNEVRRGLLSRVLADAAGSF